MESDDTFDGWYRRGGLPEADRDAWVAVLLTSPRNRDTLDGKPTESDRSAAYAALRSAGKPTTHDAVQSLAWRLCVAREGTRLLDRMDAVEVSAYVRHGGTLAESRDYLAAVLDHAVTPPGEVWKVWQRFEVSFSATRFEQYRRMGVSPEDLAWFAARGQFTEAWDVQRIHLWANDNCPGAPWRTAALYRLHGFTPTDVTAWEQRRAQGEDVAAALEMLVALTGPATDTR